MRNERSGAGCLTFILAVVLSCPFIIWGATRAWWAIQFSVNCGGYLKRAADANTRFSAARMRLPVLV